MNADSILTDVRYALKQLRYSVGLPPLAIIDCVRRATDALERVEAEVGAEMSKSCSTEPADENDIPF